MLEVASKIPACRMANGVDDIPIENVIDIAIDFLIDISVNIVIKNAILIAFNVIAIRTHMVA